jgi:hypothetical protein
VIGQNEMDLDLWRYLSAKSDIIFLILLVLGLTHAGLSIEADPSRLSSSLPFVVCR